MVSHPFSVTFRGFYSYLKELKGNKLKHKNLLFLLMANHIFCYFKGISYIKHIVKYQLWYITVLKVEVVIWAQFTVVFFDIHC